MDHAIWKGHITFGLLNIPVRLCSAEKKADLHFHLLDSRNQARVRYQRINDETGQEVPWDKTVTAFEYNKGNYVVLDEKELDQIKVETSSTIQLLSFVNTDTLDPIYFNKPYYLIPEKHNDKGYILLREALNKSNTAAISKVVIRRRQYLAALMPFHNALILHGMRYFYEIAPLSDFNFPETALTTHRINAEELELATQLVHSMTTSWDPTRYHDEYQDALKGAIEKKVKSKKKVVNKIRKKKSIQPASNATDFINLIKKSLVDLKPTTRARKS